MEHEDYEAHDGLGLAALVASGEVSAAELLAAARARAAAVDGRLNAIVVRMEAEADARAAGPLEGPFAGVPFLLKDLAQEYAGTPTSMGCRALARVPAREHSTVVERWLAAGLVVFGKTNTPEFGAKAVTEPELFGPTRNPWALDRTPGGSSGGTAAAVAAGIVPVAGASDGGGSIRIPAA
ncbi:MAG: Amidase, partial [Solirubrobacterales bacterium]|nr:Amidase [Solirubrobacterales bacterium]